MKKKGPFYIAEIKEIDRKFYQGLDDSFVFNRALTLHAAAKKQDEFLKFADDMADCSARRTGAFFRDAAR